MKTYNTKTDLVAIQHQVRNTVHRLTRTAVEPDDLCQIVLTRLWKGHKEAICYSYLRRVVLGCNTDLWRAAQRRIQCDSLDRLIYNSDYPVTVMQVVADQIAAPSCEDEYEATEALSRVSSVNQPAFLLHIQGYKYQEIADKLGIPLGTVRSRIFQARKQIAV